MPDRPFLVFATVLAWAVPLVAGAQITRQPLQPPPGPGVIGDPTYGAPVAMAAERPSTVTDPNHRLAPGDVLSFKVEQDRDVAAASVIVATTGDVLIEPLPQAVHVAGLTPRQAGDEIKRLLDKDYYYNASVRLALLSQTPQAAGFVTFSGAVARIGKLPIYSDRPMKLSEAITELGGFSRYANDRKVRVTRPDSAGAAQIFIVDVKAVLQEGKVEKDMLLKSGDSVFIFENWGKF